MHQNVAFMRLLSRAVLAAALTALVTAAPAAADERVRTTDLGINGVSQVTVAATQDGIPLFGAERHLTVDASGTVVAQTGDPLPDATAPTLTPAIDAPAALAAALAGLSLNSAPAPTPHEQGGPRDRWTFADGSTATLIRYPTADGAATIAWRLLVDDRAASGGLWDAIVDGRDGALLYRNSLTSEATASVFPAWPGAPVGGTQSDEDFTPWLTSTTTLEGNNAHVWADVDADYDADPAEEIPPSSGTDYDYPLTPVASSGTCPASGCTWDEATPGSWETNKRQDATQIFSLVNRMHDWLEQPDIGFGEAAGNFQQVNSSGQGWDADPVRVHTSFGADTDGGLPASPYRNNAAMSTPPDGYSPDMRMYLWGFGRPGVFGGGDAVVVLHEYTHGLSNRLVVDGDGNSTLILRESKAMGEGWSDWYALDYVVAHGFQTDDPATPGGVRGGPLLSAVRTQPIDCPVATDSPACPGTPTAGPGGYTFADYGRLLPRGPSAHDDGEIWSETLWDLRRAVGPSRARTLITRAMQLSASRPSFLDMRNAIVTADRTLFVNADVDTIWGVFAQRGMGWFASVANADDVTPIADDATPPASTGTLAGRITLDGAPVAGAQVRVDGGLATTTDADGRYTLALPSGTYPRVFVTPVGDDAAVERDVAIGADATRTLDVELGTAPPPPPVVPVPAPPVIITTGPPAPEPAPGPASAPSPPAEPTPAPTIGPEPTEPTPHHAGTATLAPQHGATLGGALRKGVPLRLSCTTRCRARIVVRIGGRVAGVTTRRLRAHHRTTVRVHLRPRTRHRLHGRSRVRAVVTVQLRWTGGQRQTLHRNVVLRRR
jgi:hypothetical protein